jgi:dihydrofolate reductase
MRKIVAGLFVSADGTVEFPNEFVGAYMDGEVGQDMGAQMAARDTILLGRKTYEEMAQHWPAQEGPMAAQMNDTPKLVVSSTLNRVDEWQNSALITGDPVTELNRLKQDPGGNILIVGSGTLAESLLRARVVDELYMLIFPVVFGRGRRLFDTGGDPVPLKLIECRSFSNGVVKHVYSPGE